MQKFYAQFILFTILMVNSLPMYGMFVSAVRQHAYRTVCYPRTMQRLTQQPTRLVNEQPVYSDAFISEEKDNFSDLKNNIERFLMQDYVREALIYALNSEKVPFNELSIKKADKYSNAIYEIRRIAQGNCIDVQWHYDQLKRDISYESDQELESLTHKYESLLDQLRNVCRNAEVFSAKYEIYKYEIYKASQGENGK